MRTPRSLDEAIRAAYRPEREAAAFATLDVALAAFEFGLRRRDS